MPIITPPTPWAAGPITVAMMNAKINALITELQITASRGIQYDATATATASANSTTFVTVPGLGGTFTVDSPRTLQAVFRGTITGDTAGAIADIIVNINGITSVYCRNYIPAAGAGGTSLPNLGGVALPVSAGTVTITCQIRKGIGSGIVTVGTDARLQINDVGAS